MDALIAAAEAIGDENRDPMEQPEDEAGAEDEAEAEHVEMQPLIDVDWIPV